MAAMNSLVGHFACAYEDVTLEVDSLKPDQDRDVIATHCIPSCLLFAPGVTNDLEFPSMCRATDIVVM